MWKQIKQARDRFFGTGEADTSVPVLDGPLKPNHLLEQAQVLLTFDAPEDLCVTADGRLVVADGLHLQQVLPDGRQRTLARLDAPVQALCAYRDGMVAATAGDLHFVGGALDGKQFRVGKASFEGCINALAQHPDGSLIVSEGSGRHAYAQWSRDLLSDGASGRVLQYIPEGDHLRILKQGMRFAFGVQIDAQGAVYATESWAHRMVRISPGSTRAVYQDIPGYPSRFAQASGGGYWLTVFAPRNQLVEFVLRETGFKRDMMARVEPRYWICPALRSGEDFFEPLQQGAVRQMGVLKPWAPARSYGLVVRLDEDFQPLYSLHSRVGGKHHGMTAVAEFEGHLLVLSKGAGRLLRIPLSDIE